MKARKKAFPFNRMDVYGIKNKRYIKKIKWNNRLEDDYYYLSKLYYNIAELLFEEIINNKRDHEKTDMWFFPAIALKRQAIELIIKALICKIYPEQIRGNKNKIATVFQDYKHNLIDLYMIYDKDQDSKKWLTPDERKWIMSYLKNVETDDPKSDVFRFPFESSFYNKYKDKYISVYDTYLNLATTYELFNKCYIESNTSITLPNNTEYLVEAASGIEDCYMWDSMTGNSYYKHITGYANSIKFLLKKCNKKQYFNCIMFLYRNLFELMIKRIYTLTCKIAVKTKKSYGHYIKKIWENSIENHPVDKEEKAIIAIVTREIIKIYNLDKDGAVFRYPTDYSLQYYLNNKEFDINNTFNCYKSLYNFLDAFICMLEAEEDYISDMKYY